MSIKSRAARAYQYRQTFLPAASAGRDICLVYGNCQSVALQKLLKNAEGFPFSVIPIPQAQEITAGELRRIRPLLKRTRLFITQMVRDDYRGLPTGTEQLAAYLPATATTLTYPVMFYEGLHPWQVYVRVSGDISTPAPHTSYHDLRVLHAAGMGWSAERAVEFLDEWSPDPATLLATADASVVNLAEREASLDLTCSDHIKGAGAHAFHSINHPSTRLMVHLADQVCERVQAGKVRAPDHELLGELHSPIEDPVLRALHLPDAAEPWWVVDGERFSVAEMARKHLAFYASQPEVLAAGLTQHRDRMVRQGLAVQ